MSDRIEIQCVGKMGYDTWDMANNVGIATRRHNGDHGRGKGIRMQVYKCPTCHLYHIGSRQRRAKRIASEAF